MADTNNTPSTTSEQQVVSMDALRAASEFIATKEEVKEQIADAVAACANITFASTEEVLALFQKKSAETHEAGA